MIGRSRLTVGRRAFLAAFITAFPIFSAGRAQSINPEFDLHELIASYERHKAAMIAEMDGGDDEVWYAEHEKMFAQVVEIENTTPRTPAGLAQKIRVIEENDHGDDRRVMRRLVADAAAVAGVA